MALRIKKTEQCEENYMPPVRVLQRSLGTKKQSYAVGDKEFPGLLDYNDNPWPVLAFMGVLVLEFLGLFVLMKAGLVWIAAGALFFVDLALAIVRHLPVARIQHLRNMLVLTTPGVHMDRIRQNIRRNRIGMWLASAGIVAVALGKIIGFYSFVAEINPMTLFIIVTYILVAVIHLAFTGYFCWWFVVECEDWLMHRRYLNALSDWQYQHRVGKAPRIGASCEVEGEKRSHSITIAGLVVPGYVVERHVLINNDLLDANRNLPQELFQHFGEPSDGILPTMECTGVINGFLMKNTGAVKGDAYTLFTWGVLTDDHVKKFCNMIPMDGDHAGRRRQDELACRLLEHQLLNILGLSTSLN